MKSILLLLTTSAIEHIIIVSTGTIIITARCYASAIYAMALCLSVCLSVTSRHSIKTAKRSRPVTHTTSYDSLGLWFSELAKFQCSHQTETPNTRGLG